MVAPLAAYHFNCSIELTSATSYRKTDSSSTVDTKPINELQVTKLQVSTHSLDRILSQNANQKTKKKIARNRPIPANHVTLVVEVEVRGWAPGLQKPLVVVNQFT